MLWLGVIVIGLFFGVHCIAWEVWAYVFDVLILVIDIISTIYLLLSLKVV